MRVGCPVGWIVMRAEVGFGLHILPRQNACVAAVDEQLPQQLRRDELWRVLKKAAGKQPSRRGVCRATGFPFTFALFSIPLAA